MKIIRRDAPLKSLLLSLCAVTLLLGSGGVVIVISTNLVSNDASSAKRWEPSASAGSTWAHTWAEIGASRNSFASAWNGAWGSPVALTAPNGLGSGDVNLNWDSARSRFVFAALDLPSSGNHGVWYGYSTDATGTQWVFGNNNGSGPQPIFSASSADWDYPSIGVDSSGRVIVGAVRFLPCPTGECDSGYFAVLSSDGNLFSGASQVPTGAVGGAQSRVVATNSVFEAFVPTLNSNGLPTYIARYESSDGANWSGDLGIGVGSFGAPNNNTPPGSSSTILYYAPLLAAQGYTNGLWSVAFQANNGGWNNVIMCASDRGCGFVNSWTDDQFLAGISVSGDSGYWVAYYTYASPRNPPLITQALYFPSGQPGIGATTNTGIDPTTWLFTSARCSVNCYAAGDYHTVSSNPFAAASTPFIQQGLSGRPDDLFQSFVQDPSSANVPNFRPNFVPIAPGADVTGLAKPVAAGAYGLPAGRKIGLPRR